MQIEIVEATVDHAKDLAPILRESDKDEVWASGRLTPLEALTMSVNASEVAWTALLDGRPHIMWGAAEYEWNIRTQMRVGVVWLLSSDEMYKIPGRFLTESAAYVSKMHESFDTLFNYVHAANIKSQRWLLNLGFHKVSIAQDYRGSGETFILFSRSK